MRTRWPEQHTCECSAKRKKPVTQSTTHHPGGTPDEISNHNPRLLNEECCTNQAVRLQVAPQGGLRKQRRARSSDKVRRDRDDLACSDRLESGLQVMAQH